MQAVIRNEGMDADLAGKAFRDAASYISHLAHVSQSCCLSLEEELELWNSLLRMQSDIESANRFIRWRRHLLTARKQGQKMTELEWERMDPGAWVRHVLDHEELDSFNCSISDIDCIGHPALCIGYLCFPFGSFRFVSKSAVCERRRWFQFALSLERSMFFNDRSFQFYVFQWFLRFCCIGRHPALGLKNEPLFQAEASDMLWPKLLEVVQGNSMKEGVFSTIFDMWERGCAPEMRALALRRFRETLRGCILLATCHAHLLYVFLPQEALVF